MAGQRFFALQIIIERPVVLSRIPTTPLCYTPFVVDVFSQRILGWAIATTMTTKLVQDALAMAVWQRDHHGHPIAGGVVHPSDKGSHAIHLGGVSVNPWPTTRSCP